MVTTIPEVIEKSTAGRVRIATNVASFRVRKQAVATIIVRTALYDSLSGID